jgi:hypothetical protein
MGLSTRRFPVLNAERYGCPESVPWERLSEEWAQRLHQQSLERLAFSGGLDPFEIAANVHKLTPEEADSVSEEQCVAIVKELAK